MFQRFTRGLTLTHFFNLFLAISMVASLTACGGSSSGGGGVTGTVSALTLPDRIQLTNNDESAGSAREASSLRGLLSRSAAARGAYGDTGTDYTNAIKRSWVKDTDALNMINTILGVCAETTYANFINQGPYLALVRDADEGKQSQSGSSSTSTTTEELMEIIVDATRASNSAPMIIKIWLYVNGPGDMPMLVRGYFIVSQGVSADYPFGVMEAHFKGNMVGNDGSIGAEIMQMALGVSAANGSVILENVDDEGGGEFESHRKVRVVANADVSEGNAYVSDQHTQCDQDGCTLPSATVSQIAFNDDYFMQTSNNVSAFFAKNDFSHRIFRYQLFDATTGAEVSLTSGFPITTADGKHGYVGYYGLWMNNNGTLADGATVTDMNGNPYTVFRSEGKLTKHTRDSMPLSELNGAELSKYVCDMDGCNDLIVAWDSDTDTFVTMGYRNQSNGQMVYDTTGLPATVTFQEWEGAWCESLKAFLRLGGLYFDNNNDATTPTDASTVYYHAEQTLSPGDASDLTLYTWSFTLDMPIDQTGVTNAGTDETNYWGSQSEKTFHFVASEMMLYDATETYPATLPSGVTIPDGSNLQWGYHIGPLTTTHYYDNQSPFQWEAHNAETYYTWNTGADQWNQLVTVVDGNGAFASFDPPISFSYTHTTANDANGLSTYNGKKFRLEYDGFSLNMPWDFDAAVGEWVPLINLTDGTQITDGDSNTYVVKAVEEALIMNTIADPGTLTYTEVGAPELTYDATKTALVGDVPTGVELKVIKGEVIE